MNPYIYPILLDKTKIGFLKEIRYGLPSCRYILDFLCSYFKISIQEIISESRKAENVRIRRYFAYLCYKIHAPEFIDRIKTHKEYERFTNEIGLCSEIKTIINRKQHSSVYNLIKVLINEIELYQKTREEVLYLERNLLKWWNGW